MSDTTDIDAQQAMWARRQLALIILAYALSLRSFRIRSSARARLASRLLLIALILLPGGFFLGGVFIYGGDPGLGIVLSPIGAAALLAGVVLVATNLAKSACTCAEELRPPPPEG